MAEIAGAEAEAEAVVVVVVVVVEEIASVVAAAGVANENGAERKKGERSRRDNMRVWSNRTGCRWPFRARTISAKI